MIRNKVESKAWDLNNRLAGEAQLKFIQKVMEWENVSFEEAQAICLGRTDPIETEYTLGFKLADPIFQIAMNMQRKKKREQAIKNFEATLTEPELKLFRETVLTQNTKEMMKNAFKKKNIT